MSRNTATTNYNSEKLYTDEIKPLLNQIKKICVTNNLPFISCVATANNDTKTTYRYDGVLTGTLGVTLSDNKFAKHLCIANGFDVKAPGTIDDFSDVAQFVADNPASDAGITEIPADLLEE